MALKIISIFLFILKNVLVASTIRYPQQNDVPILNVQQDPPCSSYYGMFFIDNTVNGNKYLLEQLVLVGNFFQSGNVSNYSGSVTIVSQSNYSVTNNFSIAVSNDYATLYQEIYQIMKQIPGGDQLSFINLLFEIFTLDFSDKSKYSLNPFLVFFVNSNIQNLNVTATLTSKFKNIHKLKTLSIVMDDKYTSQAAQLVGGQDYVYVYQSSDENIIAKTNN